MFTWYKYQLYLGTFLWYSREILTLHVYLKIYELRINACRYEDFQVQEKCCFIWVEIINKLS